jgi:hypothetical protein
MSTFDSNSGFSESPSPPDDIVVRLRQNEEMLKNGHQKNLTKLWHSQVVKDAAADAREAAGLIERLREAMEHVTELLVDTWHTAMEGDPEKEAAVVDARAALGEPR